MALPNSGTFSYNGVAWISLYKSKVQVKPIRDSASRALVAREYSLDVEGRIAALPGSTTDADLAQKRQLLEEPAGALRYQNKGFGALNVNIPGGRLWDMAYGPWPEVLAWDPIGNDRGCLVRWRCVTQVPCEDDPRPKGIVEYCYTLAWDIDEDGYTTRTIDGHLVVEATRPMPNSRRVPDNADAYRDRVVPDLPRNFRRTQNFKLSEDKRRLDFHFEDEEISDPLPDGVSRADVRHRVRWQLPKNGPMMTATIGGTIALPSGMPKSAIWDKISLILRSRWPVGGTEVKMKEEKPSFVARLLGVTFAGNARATFLLGAIEIDEEVFGRASSFSASCIVLGTATTPQFLLAANNLWQPISGTSGDSWRTSIFSPTGSGKAFAPRGMAGMTFQNGDDAIVDLCARADPPRVLQSTKGGNRVLKTKLPPDNSGRILDPRSTWLQYRLRLRLIEDDRVARHKPLSGTTPTVKPVPPLEGFIADASTSPGLKPPQPNEIGGFIAKPLSGPGPDSTGAQGAGYISKTPDLLQQVGAPSYTIRLEGSATRIGYPIPTPRLSSVGGIAATQIDQDVAQEQVSSIGGLPIYRADFRVDYILPDDPKGMLPMPVNPAVD